MWDVYHLAILEEGEVILLVENTIQIQGRDRSSLPSKSVLLHCKNCIPLMVLNIEHTQVKYLENVISIFLV